MCQQTKTWGVYYLNQLKALGKASSQFVAAWWENISWKSLRNFVSRAIWPKSEWSTQNCRESLHWKQFQSKKLHLARADLCSVFDSTPNSHPLTPLPSLPYSSLPAKLVVLTNSKRKTNWLKSKLWTVQQETLLNFLSTICTFMYFRAT